MTEFLLPESDWPAMPDRHREFLAGALPVFRTLTALSGVAAGGSFISNRLDGYSDLDLVVVVASDASPLARADREAIAARFGPLLGAFTGEHVNEPRLLICLYGPPLLHVDLKFLPAADLNPRVEDPVVLWDRDGEVRRALAAGHAAYPSPDLQWIEDRFWVWVHYAASKIGRGELLEAVDFLGALRRFALGPLALQLGGARPDGVRRIEDLSTDTVASLVATVGQYDASSCCRALSKAIALYRGQRAALGPPSLVRRSVAEAESVAYLEAVGQTLGT
ncbi:MAG TPA: hypothetical protein VGQ37_11320 [Vicinamibacterales bacterium]|nr:hypothetical protein [Vicinamibacterales bacterium]